MVFSPRRKECKNPRTPLSHLENLNEFRPAMALFSDLPRFERRLVKSFVSSQSELSVKTTVTTKLSIQDDQNQLFAPLPFVE